MVWKCQKYKQSLKLLWMCREKKKYFFGCVCMYERRSPVNYYYYYIRQIWINLIKFGQVWTSLYNVSFYTNVSHWDTSNTFQIPMFGIFSYVNNTHTNKWLIFHGRKQEKTSIVKKLLCPKMSHAAILVSLLFSKWTKTKQKQKNFVNKTQKVL